MLQDDGRDTWPEVAETRIQAYRILYDATNHEVVEGGQLHNFTPIPLQAKPSVVCREHEDEGPWTTTALYKLIDAHAHAQEHERTIYREKRVHP